MFVLKTVNVFGKENVIMKSVGHITYILKPLIKTTNYKNLQQGLLTETKAFTRVVNPLPGLSLVFLSTLAKSLRITILLVRVMPWNSSFHFWCAFSAFPQPHRLWKKHITVALNSLPCLKAGDLGTMYSLFQRSGQSQD